jgi:hypothetical protein
MTKNSMCGGPIEWQWEAHQNSLLMKEAKNGKKDEKEPDCSMFGKRIFDSHAARFRMC